jgi:hypothetical protein
MRSKFLVCAAIAAVGVSASFASAAHAAGRRDKHDKADKSAKPKPTELHADDKAIKRQTQWEDKVMGPDSTRKDLEKIARARAVTEKAERDKEQRDRQAALEPAPAPKVVAPKKNEKTEVSLLTTPAMDKNDKNDAKAHEISPQLATAAAQKAPSPIKAADDKFIDKLLREEDAPSKKRASSTDKELDSLLAGAKESKGHKRGDSVDDLLKTADKGPAMPAPRAQSGGLPEWAKQPEIAPTAAPPPPPAVVAKVAPKNDGVIHVVQGAAGNAPAVVAPSRPAPIAARASRRSAAKPPVSWNDPFAEKKPVADASSKSVGLKAAASRPSASSDSSWNDPFAEPAGESRKSARHAPQPSAPAAPSSAPKRGGGDKSEPAGHPAGWKDPFTKAPSEPTRAPVAMRELGKNESSKWEIAAHRPATRTVASDAHPATGWSVLKKRAR